jgi:hypothetical protein
MLAHATFAHGNDDTMTIRYGHERIRQRLYQTNLSSIKIYCDKTNTQDQFSPNLETL